jgi:hypothetical protein
MGQGFRFIIMKTRSLRWKMLGKNINAKVSGKAEEVVALVFCFISYLKVF